MKAELAIASVAALLTLAISLITMGVDYLKAGDTTTGIVCLIVGAVLLVVTVFLYEWGITQSIKEKTTPTTWKK